DIIGAFIEECCGRHTYAVVAAGDLYKAYEAWCKDNGEYTKSQRFFGTSLGQRGFERTRSNGTHKWRGIGLLTESEREFVQDQDSAASAPLEADWCKVSGLNSSREDFTPNHVTGGTSDTVTTQLSIDTETLSDPKEWELI
ncbi:MAG: primase-like DNA-binding domain-containing protein, partial [Capsulimonas sp.]|uniref:primase-like DNA-binding domain-containing protein n=1 Tax=Capsulimonas sp. TaxID=2494211 RepID=UPI003265D747